MTSKKQFFKKSKTVANLKISFFLLFKHKTLTTFKCGVKEAGTGTEREGVSERVLRGETHSQTTTKWDVGQRDAAILLEKRGKKSIQWTEEQTEVI